MSADDIAKKLKPWIEQHRRTAYKPIVKDGNPFKTHSKFCGTPFIGPDAPWPNCEGCKQPMRHIVQLDLRHLPGKLSEQYGTGLLQLFYCTRDECQGEGGWGAFDGYNLARIVQPDHTRKAPEVPEQDEEYPAKEIVGWEKFDDMPGYGEYEELGVEHDYKTRTRRIDTPELKVELDSDDFSALTDVVGECATGEKLGGWPCWVQGVEYPECPKCKKPMHLVFQIDSEKNVPFMWGDAGIGHITQCPTHKDVVAFGWACG